MLKFLLIVNKQGQIRISKHYEHMEAGERRSMEADVTRKCLTRTEEQCPFFEYNNIKVVFKRYSTLFFIIGIDNEENELAIQELIHHLVETFDKYFEKVCELDIMFQLDKVHMVLDEMIMNGRIMETNRQRILAPLRVIDQVARR